MKKVNIDQSFIFKKNKNMYNTLTQERYDKMQNDVMWMNTLVKVCDNCFLKLTT